MYRESVEQLAPGMVVAEDVTDDAGQSLLRVGTTLTPSYIEALRRRGFTAIHVRDGLVDDVPVKDIISAPLRRSAASHLATVFEGAVLAAQIDPTARPSGVDDAIARMGDRQLRMDDRSREAVAALFEDVERLLSEAIDNHAEAGLESLKTYSNYTFQHSVDVAAVGALLGYRAGLDRLELRELALGCLLHDIGKTYIDLAILDKPGTLTDAEFAEIQRHPQLGFELIRRMPLASILPAHVAYQHHERQDGAGYPRGLKGSNKLIRTSVERFDSRRMLLIAEVAAVADVYSALTSDRPYRPALHHDVAADIVAGMAGRHLNRAIVDLFLRTFPRYPVGHWVVVTGGPYVGWRGVVVRVPAPRPDRPEIRLTVDADGVVIDPVELDLRVDDVTQVVLGAAPVRAAVAS
jgi:HD-GYP domain-containing protein (c-di-GMP phosphodiesterase class II)